MSLSIIKVNAVYKDYQCKKTQRKISKQPYKLLQNTNTRRERLKLSHYLTTLYNNVSKARLLNHTSNGHCQAFKMPHLNRHSVS